jgi:hypothetical protein
VGGASIPATVSLPAAPLVKPDAILQLHPTFRTCAFAFLLFLISPPAPCVRFEVPDRRKLRVVEFISGVCFFENRLTPITVDVSRVIQNLRQWSLS